MKDLENGWVALNADVAATRKDYFDINGRLTWSTDERGFLTHSTYDVATGALTERIDDVDTSIVTGAPSAGYHVLGGMPSRR